MTGYGQASAEGSGLRIAVELRSGNSRYPEVRLRVPPELMSQEGELRRRILRQVRRGRVEAVLAVERAAGTTRTVVVNRGVVEALRAAAEELRGGHGIDGRLDLATLLALPGVLELREAQAAWGSAEQAILEQALGGALAALDEERCREGEVLGGDLRRRVEVMRHLAQEIGQRAAPIPAGIRRKLVERLAVLAPGVELDPSRIAQEVVFLADRADITEELVRLRGHLDQLGELLHSSDGEPLGKRLEFLLQEIHRETNTITSKSPELDLTRRALELKVEAEKVREQVQNLE
jgi:uncharacterized protein (TIGR00255 family)